MRKSVAALGLLGFGAAVTVAGAIAAHYSPRDRRTRLWYELLEKPAYNPPQFVFPVVWTVLYSFIALSGWRTWVQEDSPQRSRALRLWLSQLATNANWTRLFFGKHQPKRALGDVLSLEGQIISYILAAREVDPAAAALFIPYATWVAFATILNAEVVRRNPDAERLTPATQAA